MISITVNNKEVERYLRVMPKEAGRAAEIALDKTAFEVKSELVDEMRRVFDNPTRFTLNSLKVTRTHNHNMEATVWFKEPSRMGQHYLVPQVEGGQRKLKGFERALDNTKFVPGLFARKTQAGNISPGQIRQILSVLGRAQHTAGYSSNLTSRSAKRNRKPRDYVYITKRHGRLLPGIYERFQTSRGFGYKTKRSLPFGEWQRGRTRGRFSSVIRARGLRPIMIKGRQRQDVKPLLDFYGVSTKVADAKFKDNFLIAFDRILSR